MTKYKYQHDSERWLRSNAALYERKGSLQMARNMTLCADEIKALRARFAYWQDDMNAALKHRDDLHARVVKVLPDIVRTEGVTNMDDLYSVVSDPALAKGKYGLGAKSRTELFAAIRRAK